MKILRVHVYKGDFHAVKPLEAWNMLDVLHFAIFLEEFSDTFSPNRQKTWPVLIPCSLSLFMRTGSRGLEKHQRWQKNENQISMLKRRSVGKTNIRVRMTPTHFFIGCPEGIRKHVRESEPVRGRRRGGLRQRQDRTKKVTLEKEWG